MSLESKKSQQSDVAFGRLKSYEDSNYIILVLNSTACFLFSSYKTQFIRPSFLPSFRPSISPQRNDLHLPRPSLILHGRSVRRSTRCQLASIRIPDPRNIDVHPPAQTTPPHLPRSPVASSSTLAALIIFSLRGDLS